MNNYSCSSNYAFVPPKPTYLTPKEIFFNNYNRGPSDDEIIKMIHIRFPNIQLSDLVRMRIIPEFQTMDRCFKDKQTNNIYYFKYENMYWHNHDESINILTRYGEVSLVEDTIR